MFHDSARFYSSARRARSRTSYQAYLAGDLEEIIAADTAADQMNPTVKAVLIGVATGALTLIVNRWLERLLK